MIDKAVVVGAGIFGCTAARVFADAGFKVTVKEKNKFVSGMCYTYDQDGIDVHKFGSHIFHTDDEEVWKFATSFSEFNNYRHKVVAIHDGETYFLPFNLSLINQLFKTAMTPAEAESFIESKKLKYDNPKNLEEQAESLVGKDIYEAFIKNYTKNQWHTDPKDLDPSIIKRLPVRYNYNTEYFNDRFQGIPILGYTKMCENMLDSPNIKVELGVDYLLDEIKRDAEDSIVIYTGALDELMSYKHGCLSWRSLDFKTKILKMKDFQGTSVINYVDNVDSYTRVHEFKHYRPDNQNILDSDLTVIQYEYPADWKVGADRYYPVHTSDSDAIYQKYVNELRRISENIVIGGRLGMYRYYDMDDAIGCAIDVCKKILSGEAK